MAKRKKKNSQIRMVVAILAIAATVMVAFDGLKSGEYVAKGYELAFGADLLSLGETSLAKLNFNVFAFAGYFLPLVAAIIIFVVKGKVGALASALCLIGASVVLIILPGLVEVEYAIVGPKLTWDFSWGILVSIGLSALAGIGALYESFLELK